MKNKKLAKKIVKILILLLSLILLIKLISFTYSKYESSATTNPNVPVAFYVINKDYKTMSLNLDSLFPSDTPYVYDFAISNTDGTNRCETDMEYDLSIRTTTNLPIDYELYMNQAYDETGATNILQNDEIAQDESGTYFRRFTTDTNSFTYKKDETNTYQLVLRFPAKYNTINYQDVIEGIEITVNSRQVI